MKATARGLAALLLFPALLIAAPALIVDGDGDGVSDERDDCPYSPSGESVNADGCRIVDSDADHDGVLDVADLCPYSISGSRVDADGCALDDDFDGIANGRDLCPDTALGERVDADGCDPGAPRSGRTAVAAAGGSPPRTAIAAARLAAATRVPVPVERVVPVALRDTVADARQVPAAAPAVPIPRGAAGGAAERPAVSAPAAARRLPAPPQIVLTPAEVQTLQAHPAGKIGVPPPPAAEPVAQVPAPLAGRLPDAPVVTLSPDEMRAVDGSINARRKPGTRRR